MTHYVVLCDWALENQNASGVDITGIAHSLEEAKAIFAEAVVDEKKYAEENNWEIFEDSDVAFCAGEEGYYAAEHTYFYIQEVL